MEGLLLWITHCWCCVFSMCNARALKASVAASNVALKPNAEHLEHNWCSKTAPLCKGDTGGMRRGRGDWRRLSEMVVVRNYIFFIIFFQQPVDFHVFVVVSFVILSQDPITHWMMCSRSIFDHLIAYSIAIKVSSCCCCCCCWPRKNP